MEPRSRRVSGSDGIDLHLLEWSAEGVPLLLLHGFGNETHIWDDFAPAVAPHYRTLALDHRGHGESAWAKGGADGYDLEKLVDDVEAVTASLGVERLVLVGHSLGGRVATLFAGRHPERMAGLVLVDIGPELDPRGVTRIRQETEQSVDPAFAGLDEYARLLSLHYPAAKPHAIQRMARYGARQREDGRWVLKMDPALRGGMARPEDPDEAAAREERLIAQQWEALRALPCPTLVVRGAASDVFSADTADRMVDEVLQQGRLAVVPQAGHSVMTDNPDGFRAAVTAFVLA
ncbi:MAG: alpha/beta fold hydrolase [Myxococcota bacterium]